MSGEIVLNFDGAVEPVNPGGWMTWVWVVRMPGDTVLRGTGVRSPDRSNTNNAAEWFGLGCGLADLKKVMESGRVPGLASATLVVRGDSQLVVNQLAGAWLCRSPKMRECRDRCRAMLEEMYPAGSVGWRAEWVPRAKNAEADALTRQAYFEATGKAMPDRRPAATVTRGSDL